MQEIELKIDEAFKNIFLIPREKLITDFLVNFLNSRFKFKEDNREVNVISLFYYASSPLSFLFIEPNYEYYSADEIIDRFELELDDYSYIDVEELCIKVLDENNINYSEHLDKNGNLDTANYWENRHELEHKFLLTCWKNAKEKTQSKIFGFLESSDGAGGIYDLDNGYCISDDNHDAKQYLESKGYHD